MHVHLRYVCLWTLGVLFTFPLSAQNVGVGTNAPDASAKLQIQSSNTGLLIPNIALTSVSVAAPVSSPATGLMIWNTNAAVTGGSGTGYYYWDGTIWQRMATGGATDEAWQLLGNTGTNPTTNFVGTADAQDLVFRTNNLENMRVNTNGNVGIGTTSDIARLYVNVPNSDATTNYGLYNYFDGTDGSATYGIRNFNYGAGNGTKYGIYSNINSEGTGGRYGIYNAVSMNTSSNSSASGMRNYLYPYGSGTQYGIYNYLSSSSATGQQFGQRNYLYLASANVNNVYGEYTYVDYSSGSRYGEYKTMNSSSTYDGDMYGDYNDLYGSGDGLNYAVYNDLRASGTGVKYGVYNNFSSAVTSTRYGVRNEFADATGTKYGVYTYIPSGTSTGTIYGTYNSINNDGNSTKYGTYNYISGGEGGLRGSYNSVWPSTTNVSTIYGVYGYVGSSGTGRHYGGYFSAYGTDNRAVYGSNTHTTGWAGYYDGNFYANGNSIFNESGTSDHDFRVETDTRTHAFFVDAGNNVVRIGQVSGSLSGNGTTVGGTVVTYVADFDGGGVEGTAIGIGSIEYLLDGNARTKINNAFVPTTHITKDLGYSTTTEGWDDVYADNFVNISDARAKRNIENLNYGLDEILQMRPVSYILKDDPFNEPKLGLISQEVLPLVKEAVKTHDYKEMEESPGDYQKIELERMGMTYNSLIPVLIKAMQEQQEQIDALKKELEEVRNTK